MFLWILFSDVPLDFNISHVSSDVSVIKSWAAGQVETFQMDQLCFILFFYPPKNVSCLAFVVWIAHSFVNIHLQ